MISQMIRQVVTTNISARSKQIYSEVKLKVGTPKMLVIIPNFKWKQNTQNYGDQGKLHKVLKSYYVTACVPCPVWLDIPRRL